jgi:hemerythrin-like domain-containing protein
MTARVAHVVRRRMEMKPTEDLMNEHRVIERMLAVVSVAADRLNAGQDVDSAVFAGAADFFKNFADRCHHGKEEKLLFKKMMERGVSGEVGPIAVMLREHEDGRAHVRRITELSAKKLDKKAKTELIRHTRAYVELLGQHIQKEDNILYPMANQILTSEDQEELEKGFEEVEEKVMGPGVHERYHHMIEEWEEKLA